MTPYELAQAIRALPDTDLQELVTHLAHDYTATHSSTFGAMAYCFVTARAVIATRSGSLREQATKGK
jgi:hypothetical protein